MTAMELIYEGSVKNVYRDSLNPQVHYFDFTDDYSIFDWGKMPDKIQSKGKALSILGGSLFEKLSKPHSWQALAQASSLKDFKSSFIDDLFNTQTYHRLC